MANEVLKGAEALRDTISKQLDAAKGEVRSLEAQLAQANALIEQAKGNRPAAVGAVALRNPTRQEVMDVVLRVIADAGKPLKLQPLYEGLTAKGVALNGRDPSGVLSTMLWRGGQDGVLVNLKGAGYWDASKPYAPAKYHPPAK